MLSLNNLHFSLFLVSTKSPKIAPNNKMATPDANPYTAVSRREPGDNSIRKSPAANCHIRSAYNRQFQESYKYNYKYKACPS